MDNQPIQHRRILEAMEACRPGSEDLSDPSLAFLAAEMAINAELRETYRRLQLLDARVAEAFQDVPVPDGLADRISQRLAAAGSEQSASVNDLPVTQTPPGGPIEKLPMPPKRISRRWLLAGVGGLAAAAVMAALMIHTRAPVYDEPVILEMAMAFSDSDWDQGQEGELVTNVPAPDDYPLSRAVLQGSWMRWRRISGFLDRRGVAYDLTRPGGPRATLYVVKYPPDQLPGAPPLRPSFTTGNRSSSAWQRGPLLYVLVVQGGAQTYRGFLDLPREPLT